MNWKRLERPTRKLFVLAFALIMVIGTFVFMMGTHGVDTAHNMKNFGPAVLDLASDFTIRTTEQTYISSLNNIHLGFAITLAGAMGFVYMFFFLLDKG